jgi:transposase
MPKQLTIIPHLSVSELELGYRQAKNGVDSRQYQIIWLLAQGKTTAEVMAITGYSRTWIYALVKRYNQSGATALGDHRRDNQGAKPLVEDIHQAQLWQVLQTPAPDGGLWNGRKVADWLSELTQQQISRQRGWEILRQMSFRLRVPRPAHTEADPVEQEAWKKN